MNAQADAARARLRDAPWLKAPALRAVFDALDTGPGTVRAVGGAVRDTLIGLPVETVEIDLATVLEPDEVSARAVKKGISPIPTGIDFGTVTLAVNGSAFEVTTLRHDVETDGRRATVRFGSDWVEDARRRDFTLNALYCDPDGTLFDPLGGLEDCLAGRVRFIGDAAERIAEDRLRVYRFFRFSASHGGEHFDADGLAAATDAADSLGPVSAERIGHEMSRILGLPKCAKTLMAMTGTGILDIPGDALAILRRYEVLAVAPELAGRLLLLAGKGGLKPLKTRWRLSNAVVKRVEQAGQAAALVGAGHLGEAAYRHGNLVDLAMDIAGAQADWTPEKVSETRMRLYAYAPPAFPVSGAVLIKHGFAAGPQLGALLSQLEKAWIASEFTLTQKELLALAAREPG